ncbi:MAG: hypothetical protein ACRDRL_14830 [Sciscionella sp.]
MLPTRLVRDAHTPPGRWGVDAAAQAAYQAAHAGGGAALCVLGGGSVHDTNPGPVPVHTDDATAGLRVVAEAVHAAGGRVVLQLRHSGSAKLGADRVPPWSCSAVPHPNLGVVPRPMPTAVIADVVAGFAAAARRVRAGGFDGVEIHGASGYLVNQFLSPATNHRTDAYGGTTANRTRFLAEILDAVRGAVGEELVVGVRLTAEEGFERGLHPTESARIAAAVAGTVDYVHVAYGGSGARAEISPGFGDLDARRRAQAMVGAAVAVPVVAGGGVRTVAEADELVSTGVCDLVAMTRAFVADPAAGRASA